MYQLLVGEIGISHQTFLYDLQFWQVRRIVRGYRRRGILTYQLLRLTAYGSIFAMRDPKGKRPEQWLPMDFDEPDEYDDEESITEEEQNELLSMIQSMNKSKKKSDSH